jgi:hypothetical protein
MVIWSFRCDIIEDPSIATRLLIIYINYVYVIFIVAPCILITLKFLSPTNAPLYYTYKMLKYTVKMMVQMDRNM